MEKLDERMEELSRLDEKGRIKAKNPYEKSRIEYAEKLLSIAKEYENRKAGPVKYEGQKEKQDVIRRRNQTARNMLESNRKKEDGLSVIRILKSKLWTCIAIGGTLILLLIGVLFVLRFYQGRDIYQTTGTLLNGK